MDLQADHRAQHPLEAAHHVQKEIGLLAYMQPRMKPMVSASQNIEFTGVSQIIFKRRIDDIQRLDAFR